MKIDRSKDLIIAEKAMKEGNSTIAIAKEGKVIFCTDTSGLKAIFEAAESLKDELVGAAVADRIVGKAAALLYVHLQIYTVFGGIMSKGAIDVFMDRNVEYRFDRFVPTVKGKNGKNTCPFEMKVMDLWGPKEGFEAVYEMMFSERYSN